MTLSPPHVGAFCGGRFSEEKANGVTARPGTWFAEWQKSLDLLGNLAFFRENSRVSYANLQHWCICSIGAFAALVHLQHWRRRFRSISEIDATLGAIRSKDICRWLVRNYELRPPPSISAPPHHHNSACNRPHHSFSQQLLTYVLLVAMETLDCPVTFARGITEFG
jgi:hypothetical protein